jgi:hypothetical protein
MAIIRQNSVSGIVSVTAQSNALHFYDNSGNKLTSDTHIVGNVIGDVTGNVTGNLTGDVTGNISGHISGDINAGIVTATDKIVLNTLNIVGSGTSVGIGSTQPTVTLDIDGRIKTSEASSVSYASTITGIEPRAEYIGSSSNQFLVYSSNQYVASTGADADWTNMHVFHPEKDGDVTMRASMRITSGSYYFTWRVYEETGKVVFNSSDYGGYDSYESPTGQSGNVHSLKMYQWHVPGLKAGKRYNIQMAASNAAGTVLQDGTSQTLIFGRFTITSDSPGYMPGSSILLPQPRSFSTADTNYYGGNTENVYRVTQFQDFRGTADTFLGWYTLRAYSRYLDIKTNVTSDSFMFFFRATGYLYNYGHANNAFYGGYCYTNNSIINKTSSTPGTRGFSDVYRDPNGHLCARFDQSANGYSEGRLAIFMGVHGPLDKDVQVIEYIQNDNSTNYFA